MTTPTFIVIRHEMDARRQSRLFSRTKTTILNISNVAHCEILEMEDGSEARLDVYTVGNPDDPFTFVAEDMDAVLIALAPFVAEDPETPETPETPADRG